MAITLLPPSAALAHDILQPSFPFANVGSASLGDGEELAPIVYGAVMLTAAERRMVARDAAQISFRCEGFLKSLCAAPPLYLQELTVTLHTLLQVLRPRVIQEGEQE
jgi:hypothetical protein